MFKNLLKEYIKNNLEQEPLRARVFVVEKILETEDLDQEIIHIKEKIDKRQKKSKFSCKLSNLFDYEADITLDEYLEREKQESKFQKLLFKYIDTKNLKDSDVYNKVGIDRRLFSKIRGDQNYHPSKETVILLSLALELNEDEMLSLLNSASYSLPKNNIYDLIIRFCFINKIYDVKEVNNLLYEYNFKTLN